MISISTALASLRPGASWAVQDDSYEGIIWHSPEITIPTKAEVERELERLQQRYEAQHYARKRAAEYPPIEEYIDGVVKGDQAQIQSYINACLAVKAKYPKGI